ncbi:MAG: DUF411 domain-containing protein [Rhodothalassiaceae bacterium]
MTKFVNFIGLFALFGLIWAMPASALAADQVVTLYKSPLCGCCMGWAEHLRRSGFKVDIRNTETLSTIKTRLGVPAELQSCHTARVGEYVIEGHVPAADIEKLLAGGRSIRGLAVPGMPVGSPGMEQVGRSMPYIVFAFDTDGRRSEFSAH